VPYWHSVPGEPTTVLGAAVVRHPAGLAVGLAGMPWTGVTIPLTRVDVVAVGTCGVFCGGRSWVLLFITLT